MMKKVWMAASAVLMLASCSMQPKFTLTGQIADKDGQWIYLCNREEVVDSTQVSEGAFAFKGVVESPRVLYVADNANLRAASVLQMAIIEEGNLLFEAIEGGFQVSGTPANDARNTVTEQQRQLFQEYRNAETTAERRAEIEVAYEALSKEALEANLDNLYGVILLQNEVYSLSATEADELIARFAPELLQTEMMQQIMEMVDTKRRTEPGMPYIDFSQNDCHGNAISLKSVVENPANKYVLLDFWASWCGPCMAEVPFLKETYEAYHAKGFEIFGVSLDNKQDAWANAIKDKGLFWLHVSDLQGWQNAAAAEYGVRSIPANYLIDCSTGKIVATNLRGEEVAAKVAEFLQ